MKVKIEPLMIPSFSNIHGEHFGELPSSSFLYTYACILTISIFSVVFQKGFRTYHLTPLVFYQLYKISFLEFHITVVVLLPSWTLMDTAHVAETLKTCQVWILERASPPGHTPKKNFEAFDNRFQKMAPGFFQSHPLTIMFNIYWTSAIRVRHCAKWCPCVTSLNPNSLGISISLFPFYRWGNWGLEEVHCSKLQS